MLQSALRSFFHPSMLLRISVPCHTHTHRLPLSLFFWFPFLHSSNLRIQEQNDLSWASGLELQACFSYLPGIPGAGRCWFGASWVMYPGAPSKLPQSQKPCYLQPRPHHGSLHGAPNLLQEQKSREPGLEKAKRSLLMLLRGRLYMAPAHCCRALEVPRPWSLQP